MSKQLVIKDNSQYDNQVFVDSAKVYSKLRTYDDAYTNYLRDDSYGLFDTLVKQYGFVMDNRYNSYEISTGKAGITIKIT